MNGILTAFQFLTVLPVSGGSSLAAGVRWCSLVGLVLGLALVGADLALAGLVGPMVRAVLLVALLAALTGALHLDGLADSADGLLAHRTPEDRLTIMRDPRVGGFGVAAVALTLLAKSAALAELEGALRLPALIVVPAIARWTIIGLSALLPSARPGVGLGSIWRAGATPSALVLASTVALAPAGMLAGWAALPMMFGAVVVAGALGLFALGRIGGVSGDILGAAVELVETAGWVVASALARAA
ncbi:MAG: adenosylcobinamide-GDP ribazoletransferase [Dehalococcoidia bacterium]